MMSLVLHLPLRVADSPNVHAFVSDKGDSPMLTTKRTQNVLIVGDWFVDEYWFIARHHSELSSHTGPLHFRVVSEPGEAVRDLCGAGLIARVLYELRRHYIDDDWRAAYPLPESDDHSYLLTATLNKHRSTSFHIDAFIQAVQELSPRPLSRDDQTLLFSTLRKDYDLFGIGSWSKDDDDLLKHYIHAKCLATGDAIRAAFCLQPPTCTNAVDITLLRAASDDGSRDDPTIRIIRTYRYGAGTFKMINRIDWEPRRHPSDPDTRNQRAHAAINRLSSTRGTVRFDSIIVDDHTKGVMSEELVKQLVGLRSTADPGLRAKWYVRTKDKNILCAETRPSWFKMIPEIEVLAIGPDIASRFYPLERLLTANGHLTRRCYELIERLRAITHLRILVLASDRMELVVLHHDSERLFVAREPGVHDIDLQKINCTTAFFASFIHELLTDTFTNAGSRDQWPRIIANAIHNAHKHSGVKVPRSIRYRCEDPERGAAGPTTHIAAPDRVKELARFDSIAEQWRSATTGLGIIKCRHGAEMAEEARDFKCLQVWRSSTDLPGYIACIELKRSEIGRMWQAMRDFTRQVDVQRPLSILLEADPGVGKTFLAETLAKAIECHRIQRDITQMLHRDELLDLFDSIATAQAERDEPVVVFVDEINATLDNSPVYSAFLSLLEANYYMRSGTKVTLKPCIWIFASTSAQMPPEQARERAPSGEKIEKYADFVTRLSMHVEINYDSMKRAALGDGQANGDRLQAWVGRLRVHAMRKLGHTVGDVLETVSESHEARNPGGQDGQQLNQLKRLWELDGQARLEQVYVGTAIVHKYFGDVMEIYQDVLEVFFCLDPALAPARKIRDLVLALQNVQYGRIDNTNCSSAAWRNVLAQHESMLRRDDEAEDSARFPDSWMRRDLDPTDYVKVDFG